MGPATEDGDVGSAGAILRAERERQGLSVEDCARRLRARPRQVVALEAGDLTAFGGDVYVRGFLRTYAGILGVDADEVLRRHGEDPTFRGPVLHPVNRSGSVVTRPAGSSACSACSRSPRCSPPCSGSEAGGPPSRSLRST